MGNIKTGIKHGTVNGYMNLGCRCQSCRSAHTAYMSTWRRGRTAELHSLRQQVKELTRILSDVESAISNR